MYFPILSIIPTPIYSISKLEPPYERKGRVTPVTLYSVVKK